MPEQQACRTERSCEMCARTALWLQSMVQVWRGGSSERVAGRRGEERPEVLSALRCLVGMHTDRDSNFAGASYLECCWDLRSPTDIMYLGYLPRIFSHCQIFNFAGKDTT